MGHRGEKVKNTTQRITYWSSSLADSSSDSSVSSDADVAEETHSVDG